MRTEELIVKLATDAGPVRAGADRRWLGAALALGAAASAAVLVAWLGARPWDETLLTGAFWLKTGYAAALAACGWLMARRLSSPGGKAGLAPAAVIGIVGVLGLAGAAQLAAAGPGLSGKLLFGTTWAACPFRIVALAAPILAALIFAMRRLAPTRPQAAGATMGLLAGAVAMAVYSLHCRETSAAFVAVWYSLGLGLTMLLGAVAGGRLLRW